jgi:hypothetical protein
VCDDECSRVLLDDLDAVECSFLSVNLTGVILSPYSTLVNLENDTQEVKVKEGHIIPLCPVGFEIIFWIPSPALS